MSTPRTRENQINALLDEQLLLKRTDYKSGKTVYDARRLLSLFEVFDKCIDIDAPAKDKFMEVYEKIMQKMPELEHTKDKPMEGIPEKQSNMQGMTEDQRKIFVDILASSDLTLRQPNAPTSTNAPTTPRNR